jgi:hypothetical protein
MPLTARAIIVLEEIARNPNHGAARGMSVRFKEGRDAIQRAITELREAGLVKTSTYKTSERAFGRILRPTESGYHVLETRTSIQLYGLNPNNNLLLDINTDLLSHKPNSKAEEKGREMEYEDTPTFMDPDDVPKFRQRAREKKHQDKLERYETRHKKWMERRDPSNAASWTSTDSAFEFAEQMHLLWHVAPWKVTRSRFRYALDTKRAEYNTDGEIERQMMKIFFDKIKHDTRINDPEMIWRKFIVDYHLLLEQVNRENVTEAQMELERERAMSSKTRSRLRVQKQ